MEHWCEMEKTKLRFRILFYLIIFFFRLIAMLNPSQFTSPAFAYWLKSLRRSVLPLKSTHTTTQSWRWPQNHSGGAGLEQGEIWPAGRDCHSHWWLHGFTLKRLTLTSVVLTPGSDLSSPKTIVPDSAGLDWTALRWSVLKRRKLDLSEWIWRSPRTLSGIGLVDQTGSRDQIQQSTTEWIKMFFWHM